MRVNSAAVSAQVLQLLGVNGRSLSQSISALATGNRLTQASTDIAALSIATGLQSDISSLRSASLNIAQAGSMLQVADGGMNQIQGMLDRMNALAVQANNGSLSQSARKGLDTEFQNLQQEINRLSGNTNFNSVNLLDGTLNTSNALQTNDTVATKASGSLSFVSNVGAGQTIRLNGVTLTEGADFNAGGTAQATIDNLAASLNADARFNGYAFGRNGNSLTITANAAGSAGNQFSIDRAGSTAAASFTVNGQALSTANRYSLQGGTDAGLAAGDTTATGTVNDPLLASGTGNPAGTQMIFSSASDIVAGNTIDIANGEGGTTTFTYVSGAPASANQIQIGSNLEETLSNTANAINNYNGADNYGTRQLNATVSGNTLTLSGKTNSNPRDINGAALTVNKTTAGGAITNTTLNNASQGGMDASGVTNAGFTGKIQGFSATYNGADDVTASITVGGETYSARITDTTPGGNTSVRFISQNGGYFDVTLSGGNGQAVSNQTGADTFADRLDAAFSGLNFSQNREVDSFNGTGRLVGASLEIQGTNFNNLRAESIRVNSGIGGNASIEIKINGETYRTQAGLGTSIGAGDQVKLVSASDANKSITFTNGTTKIDLNTTQDATRLQDELQRDLGVPGGNGASFQTGSGTEDITNISIGDIGTQTLFGGKSLNLLSASAAAEASLQVRSALDYVTSQRANVGSYQSALEYTQSYLDTSILNQEAARSILADTDYASESTNNANLQVRNKSAIATLVQSNRLQGNILRLLGD